MALLFSSCQSASSTVDDLAKATSATYAASSAAASSASRILLLAAPGEQAPKRQSLRDVTGPQRFRNRQLEYGKARLQQGTVGFQEHRNKMQSAAFLEARDRLAGGKRPNFAGSLRKGRGIDPDRPSPVPVRPLPANPTLGKLLPGFLKDSGSH